jgi:hypothetical protein
MRLRSLILFCCLLTQLAVAIAPSCAGYFLYKNIGLHARPSSDHDDDAIHSVEMIRRPLAARAWRLPATRITVPECNLVCSIVETFVVSERPRPSTYRDRADESIAAHQRDTYLHLSVLLI